MTNPMSVVNPNKAWIAVVIGLPPVEVSMRAKTTSTHEKIKQKKQATPTPGAIVGIKNFTKNLDHEYPSKKAVSSNSRGIAEMKLVRIQIAIGTLNRQCISAIPTGELSKLSCANSKNTGSDKTTGGVILKASSKSMMCLSPRNECRESA